MPHAYLWSPSVLPKPDDWGPHIDVTGFVFLDEAARYRAAGCARGVPGGGRPTRLRRLRFVPGARPRGAHGDDLRRPRASGGTRSRGPGLGAARRGVSSRRTSISWTIFRTTGCSRAAPRSATTGAPAPPRPDCGADCRRSSCPSSATSTSGAGSSPSPEPGRCPYRSARSPQRRSPRRSPSRCGPRCVRARRRSARRCGRRQDTRRPWQPSTHTCRSPRCAATSTPRTSPAAGARTAASRSAGSATPWSTTIPHARRTGAIRSDTWPGTCRGRRPWWSGWSVPSRVRSPVLEPPESEPVHGSWRAGGCRATQRLHGSEGPRRPRRPGRGPRDARPDPRAVRIDAPAQACPGARARDLSGWRCASAGGECSSGPQRLLMACTAVAAGAFTVDQVTADLNLPADAAARLRQGEMVHSTPAESSDRELGVGLTFLVEQPLPEVLKAFRAAVDLKADPQLSASVPIHGPGTPADFASLVLEPNGAAEANRYLAASPGDTLNLSADEIQAFNALARRRRRREAAGRSTAQAAAARRATRPICSAGSAAWHRTSVAAGRSSRPPSCDAPPKRRGSCSSTRRRCSSCCSRIQRGSPPGSKSTSTGCATTSTAARTTRYAIGWRCRSGRSSPWRTASST